MLNLRQILMMRCEESSRLISDSLDRELNWSEWLGMRTHATLCAGCRKFRQQLRLLNAWSEKLFSERENAVPLSGWLSDERREQIRRAMQ